MLPEEEYKGYKIKVLDPVEERVKPGKKEVGPWIPQVRVYWKEAGKNKMCQLRMDHSFKRKQDAIKNSVSFAKAAIDGGKVSEI